MCVRKYWKEIHEKVGTWFVSYIFFIFPNCFTFKIREWIIIYQEKGNNAGGNFCIKLIQISTLWNYTCTGVHLNVKYVPEVRYTHASW